ncbi:Pol protein, partial [Phytophthora palmivora]
PLKVVSSVESNKLKHRFIGPFAVLVRHGAAYTIDLPKSMATHPTFYVGCLKRYRDPLGPPSQTEEDQGENSPPRNEAESGGGIEITSSTKFLQGGSRNSAVNTTMELSSLTTKSVQILAKDLKDLWLASLSGSLITRSKPKGYIDHINTILKLTDLVA